MAENNKKRTGSFRKLFPSLFFSNKSKEKNSQANLKSSKDYSSRIQYQNPQSVIRLDKYRQEVDDKTECIYENLTIHQTQNDTDTQSVDISSNHSSSSTLVSESVKNTISKPINHHKVSRAGEYSHYTARPQVPPKPYNEMVHTSQNHTYNVDTSQYPNVYYHSLEKLTNKISPLDEVEIYKASQVQANPASVGAEIKRVSTTFLISPKKEAEVRTIQPTRARSLSFDNNKDKLNTTQNIKRDLRHTNVKKPYNYSAPTSPIPISHKIPNIPKTVSPYEQVRKTMIESEVKRNSLSKSNACMKSTPSPRLDDYVDRSKTSTPINKETPKHEETEKEKTRQKVEAFYWQKLKELKKKEDEYIMSHSIKGSPKLNTSYSNSNCSTPNSLVREPTRSTSLPRGGDLKSYVNQTIYSQMPFIRGAPERRTDTFINSRSAHNPGTPYRKTEKFNIESASPVPLQEKLPIFHRGSLSQDYRSINQPTKRVSFETQLSKNINKNVKYGEELKVNDVGELGTGKTEYLARKVSDESAGSAPRPPVRTTSVGGVSKVLNNKNIAYIHGGHSVYSESESGSEAGEIQRILQNNSRKEEDWHDGSRIDGGHSDGEASRGPLRPRASRRDDPRRHTLAGNMYGHSHHQSQISIEMENMYENIPTNKISTGSEDVYGSMISYNPSTGYRSSLLLTTSSSSFAFYQPPVELPPRRLPDTPIHYDETTVSANQRGNSIDMQVRPTPTPTIPEVLNNYKGYIKYLELEALV